MKTISICSLFTLAICSPAFAGAGVGVAYNSPDAVPSYAGQGYALRASQPVEVPHDYAPGGNSWGGFYVGVNVGFAGDQFQYPVTGTGSGGATLGSGSVRLNSSGVIGGGQVGYNFQFAGPLVAGVEADIQGASTQGEIGVNGSIGGTSFSGSAGTRLDYLGTVRGRLGYVIMDGRGLVYGTGGFAYGGLHSYANGSIGSVFGASSLDFSKNTTATGWTVGGGFEYAMTTNWSFKSEYLFVNLADSTVYNDSLLGVPNVNVAVQAHENIFRAGLNYKFGLPAPVIVAKY